MAGPWVPLSENPLLDVGSKGEWDDRYVAHPMGIEHGDELWMYYSGSNGPQSSIGLAISSNGISWKKLPMPVLAAERQGTWDDAGIDHPSVVFDGKRYVMAYRGWKRGDPDTRSRIGIAVSADGVHWRRPKGQPILEWGGAGQWEEYGLLAPRMWLDHGSYYMNYSGKDSKTYLSSLGHASATSITDWVKSPNNPTIFHSDTRYQEVEWGTPVQWYDRLFLLVTTYFDGGLTTLWEGVLSR